MNDVEQHLHDDEGVRGIPVVRLQLAWRLKLLLLCISIHVEQLRGGTMMIFGGEDLEEEL